MISTYPQSSIQCGSNFKTDQAGLRQAYLCKRTSKKSTSRKVVSSIFVQPLLHQINTSKVNANNPKSTIGRRSNVPSSPEHRTPCLPNLPFSPDNVLSHLFMLLAPQLSFRLKVFSSSVLQQLWARDVGSSQPLRPSSLNNNLLINPLVHIPVFYPLVSRNSCLIQIYIKEPDTSMIPSVSSVTTKTTSSSIAHP